MNKTPDLTAYAAPLTTEMLSSARTMAEQMDLSSVEGILSIGSDALSQVSEVSSELVSVALDTDLDSVLSEITSVAKHVTKFSRMLRHGKALSRPKAKERIRDSYYVLKIELTKVAANLDRDRRNLIRSISLLEDTHTINLRLFQDISVAIEAGKYRKAHLAPNEIDPELCRRLDIRLSDLETSRLVCQQTATQIFMLRDSAMALLERINTINDTVFPLWTTQVALALGISTVAENRLSSANAYSAISQATKSLTDEIEFTGKCITDAHTTAIGIKA